MCSNEAPAGFSTAELHTGSCQMGLVPAGLKLVRALVKRCHGMSITDVAGLPAPVSPGLLLETAFPTGEAKDSRGDAASRQMVT